MILAKPRIEELIKSGDIEAPLELVQINSVNVRLGGTKLITCGAPWWRRMFAWLGFPVPLSKPRKWKEVYPNKNGEYVLKPHRVYLALSMDKYGSDTHVAEMRARSTTGRHGLTVALCAGVGDLGYKGQWTLEIINNNRMPVTLEEGTPIGQVVFYEATPAEEVKLYNGPDRYQNGSYVRVTPKELKR